MQEKYREKQGKPLQLERSKNEDNLHPSTAEDRQSRLFCYLRLSSAESECAAVVVDGSRACIVDHTSSVVALPLPPLVDTAASPSIAADTAASPSTVVVAVATVAVDSYRHSYFQVYTLPLSLSLSMRLWFLERENEEGESERKSA